MHLSGIKIIRDLISFNAELNYHIHNIEFDGNFIRYLHAEFKINVYRIS